VSLNQQNSSQILYN
jgi:hypothetical protein